MSKIKKSIDTIILGRMAENHLSIEDGGEILGMSRTTFARRINDPDSFTIGEMRRLCKSFDITLDELRPYL